MRGSGVAAALAGIGLFPGALLAQQVIMRVDDGRALLEEVVIGEDANSPEKVRALALSFIQREGAKHVLIQLVMGNSQETVMNAARRGRMHGLTFERAVAEIGAEGLPPQPIARLLSISGRALLSHRYAGALHEELLKGSEDPSRMDESNPDLQVLHVSLTKLGAGSTTQPDFTLQVYARAPVVSAAGAASLVRRFAKLSNATTISVSLRLDQWFLTDPGYPGVLPFVVSTAVPSAMDYLRSPSIACTLNPAGLKCGGSGFSP
jgi:hypothetical protein